MVWPSGTVTFCGKKIKERICNDASKDPDGPGGAIKINFGKASIEGW